jgi:PPK2 family polyphosphate:nucleotide phosphotransferase
MNHLVLPGQKVRLKKISTHPNDSIVVEEVEKPFHRLRDDLIALQYDLYAEGKRKLLVVLQAMDAGGKDGTIRSVFKGVNPQGVQVASFKSPTDYERAHDFLWRVHERVPAAGMIGVFNRSHYEDVLIARVDQLVPSQVWKQRYDQINDFERLLAQTGTTVLKFYLHISLDEQKKRLDKRLADPRKRWKYSAEDLEKRAKWDDYMQAYEDAIERCSTEHAPWYIIPADNKRYRNLAVTTILVEALRKMEMKLPDGKR